MTSSTNSSPPQPAWSRFVYGHGGAATLAGSLEILIFHPFDTAAKRLMSHRQRVVDPSSFARTCHAVDEVIFGSLYQSRRGPTSGELGQHLHQQPITLVDRVRHMYPGSTYAVLYKVLQRTTKFAGQPYCRDYLHRHHSHLFGLPSAPTKTATGGRGSSGRSAKGLLAMEAAAGGMVGVLEVTFLPFDRMKVLNQTNKGALQGKGLLQVIRSEGLAPLYAGSCVTATRNVVGSFLLFGATACAKEWLFGLEDYRSASFGQNMIASTIGGCIGVLCTSPMDVIKTRIQSSTLASGGASDGGRGWRMFSETLRTEGVSAFYKGITPKLCTSAPRLVFCYTLTQYFTKILQGK